MIESAASLQRTPHTAHSHDGDDKIDPLSFCGIKQLLFWRVK
jgi:hypothetical protein